MAAWKKKMSFSYLIYVNIHHVLFLDSRYLSLKLYSESRNRPVKENLSSCNSTI